jgi:ADP-dependent NAD(P)H-hydrate dehydratase / NAD(P)H-hydrate epimerase
MTELLTAAQMRAIERAAIDSGAVTGLELMERAGRGVLEAALAQWSALAAASHRAMVLCGPGNNGGDGFVVARLLKGQGWEVAVFLYGDPENLPPDARVNHDLWARSGRVRKWDARQVRKVFNGSNISRLLVVDALFGTGLTRPVPKEICEAWHEIRAAAGLGNADSPAGAHFVAVDIPSGICSDSGRDMGALPTDLTVTFHRAKVGHYLSRSSDLHGGAKGCNRLKIVDIGLKPVAVSDQVTLLAGPDRHLEKDSQQHKYAHGHVLILSGGPGKTGAARLAARGALRIGAGLVTLGVPPSAQMEVAGQISAIMLKRVPDAGVLTVILGDRRINAVCLGPGLGVGEKTRSLAAAALQGGGARGLHPPYGKSRGVVLDADALTSFADDPVQLFALLHANCVLTPHGGEFARLFSDIAAKLDAEAVTGPAFSRVDATRAAAARAGCVVLLKGPDTVIAAPDGRCSINPAQYERAAPWLATAGSGDVLAGFITGLLARGFAPMQAAQTAAWLHVESALSFGPGLIAEDIPEMLPGVFRALPVHGVSSNA